MTWRPDSIEYLLDGTDKQRRAYAALSGHSIMLCLRPFDPVLVSSLCLDLDTPASDLDIICEFANPDHFEDTVRLAFNTERNFLCCRGKGNYGVYVSAQFEVDEFLMEVYGEACPVREQNGYRHLVLAARVLECGGSNLKTQIKKLRAAGFKFEAAFAELFSLQGDPYQSFLELEQLSDRELLQLCLRAQKKIL